MKNNIRKGLLPGLFSLACLVTSAQEDPFKKINSLPETFTILPFGDVVPQGWIKDQLQDNLDGYTGHLDELVPDLIQKDDIYGKDRLTKKVKSKDVGALGDNEGDWQVQFLWWNSETQSNWWDGYIRSSILANDKKHLERIEKYVQRILSTQDKDGYLGIYDAELRYKFDNENGELWAKATLLRGLLAWYEYTDRPEVLDAVKRAVDNVMFNCPVDGSKPFYSVNPNVGGLSHGLTFTDVLEQLYYLTKEQKYLDYALFLYKDFSTHELNEDAQYKKLMDASRMLTGHGVHTYEHLRSLAAAYQTSGNPALKKAIDNFEEKINQTTTASGGPVGDEWIAGKKADATGRGYEYCSLQELLHSYASLYAKSGDKDYGDRIERLFFNAAQGARHPEQSCIAYLKSDNSYEMTGGLNGDNSVKTQTRYKYSPVHQDAAVCCVPNAGRISPYYAQYMWLKDGNSLVASLLGPSTVKSGNITVKELTNYPHENTITFEVEGAGQDFVLKIRKPDWVSKFKVNAKYKEENGFIIIAKDWKGKDAVTLDFIPEVKAHQDINGEHYFTYGALVLAHAIKGTEAKTKFFPLPGYADLKYTPEDLVVYQFAGEKVKQKGKSLIFETRLYNPKTGKNETVTLVPMDKTVLRQVTF
ncbi:glycoside hydrolase family 127 protein [Flavobacterium sp. MFBS3-15]|uniref:glycoside hydrolase family 127 protein n=1 Tax=Flavobacterium sp. MFBS3-15 TaxID=2989816 RepID=UPI0022359271|nr:glycoside hydrolase family 127 protein [Flavobacterium sp. MFBS3-15]MCW4469082.1 glycoside hydrolase family 127 protein [Flavobacterium sp. MFBS3-15]